MIQVIACDLGGVFFSEGKTVALKRLEAEYGYDRDIVYSVLTSDESYKLRLGMISDTSFWNYVRQQLPKQYDAEIIRHVWYDSYLLDNDVFSLIQILRDRYTIIAFSTNIKSRIDFLEQKYGFRKYFDMEVYSYEYQTYKQEKRFFSILLEKAGVTPEDVVVIDDQQKNLVIPKQMGMQTVRYISGKTDQLENRLKDIGIII